MFQSVSRKVADSLYTDYIQRNNDELFLKRHHMNKRSQQCSLCCISESSKGCVPYERLANYRPTCLFWT